MDAGDQSTSDPNAPGQQGVGAVLRSRRIELGMSQNEVANMVKLPTRRIEAMECERWGELPDGPYRRGFLRNVAKALNLDPVDLVARVDASQGQSHASAKPLVAPGATNIALPRRSGPAEDRHGGRKLVFGALAFALAAAVIAWSGTASFEHAVSGTRALFDTSGKHEAPAVDASTAGAIAAPATTAIAAAPSLPTPEVPGTAATAAATVAPPPAFSASQAGTSAPTPSVEKTLRFHFNGQSWVEVRSSGGKVLLQQLNAAGTEQAVDGEPPFALIVGNAGGVVLRFRGQPVDLTPYIRDSVARFTLS